MEYPAKKPDNLNPDAHFDMSKDYEKNSKSQQTIGATVIETTCDFSRARFVEPGLLVGLDIACGPGNLTANLKESLLAQFPKAQIHLSGLDYTSANIDLLKEKFGDKIDGIVGSFYDKSVIPRESLDFITSNEGLHWQPPYPEMTEIIYRQLPPEARAKYEVWALDNFKTAMQNIFDFLKAEGIAILQFGHEGQLDKLWNLIRDVLDTDKFKRYKPQVRFPLFYPKLEDIRRILIEVGFEDKDVSISAFNQDLTEDTPEDIAGFLAAFTRPGFSKFFQAEDLDEFYRLIEEKIRQTDVTEFRKNQWCRTLLKLKK